MDAAAPLPAWRQNPPTITAVLVAHDGAAWLPKALGSLAALEDAPTAWRAVDVSSTDGSADLLRDAFGAERMTYAPTGTGFGDAVRLALAEAPSTDWIWLLHDDVAVTPGTLGHLLDMATSADDIGVVGPKIREWPSLRRLLEVGLSITGTGVRETGLETGEPDAGQHDRPRDVLAVNTAGMLVRRDVWDALDGLDPDLPLFGDDIDFGWRANRAGYRVRIAPEAVVFHAEASRRSIRRTGPGEVPHYERRRALIHVELANTPSRSFWFQSVRLFVGSLLRVVGHLVGQHPEAAGDELLALRDVFRHPGRTRAARRKREHLTRPHAEIKHLFPPWWLAYQHAWDAFRDVVRATVRPETIETTGRRSILDEDLPDDDLDLDDGPSLWRRRPWLATVGVLVVGSLVAARALAPGDLRGGALSPSPDTAGGWWSLVLSSGHAVGLPSDAFGPTFALLLGVAATPVWFAPGLVVWGLLVLAAPLAALTAHRLGRMLSDNRPARIVWAASYGLLVVGSGAVAQGRIGTVVALIVAPIVVNVTLQVVDDPRWQTGLRLGIWIAVASAFAPVAFWMALAGLVLTVVIVGRRVARSLGLAVVASLVLLGPWVVQRVVWPWRMWAEAGRPLPGDADLVDLFLGTGGGPGTMPVWLTVGALVTAVLALIPKVGRGEVRIAWIVALVAALTLVAGRAVTYSTPAGSGDITPWLGLPATIFVAALLTAGLLAADELRYLPGRLAAPIVVISLVLPLGAAAWWVARGADTPLTDSSRAEIPAYLAERPGSTLVLTGDVATGVRFDVAPGRDRFLGQEVLLGGSETADAVAGAVERLLAAPSADDVAILTDAGIDAVYAPTADLEVATRIDAAPSMVPAGGDRPGSRVWTIDAPIEAPDDGGGPVRWALGGAHVLVWLVAAVLTLPVRRRETPPTDDEEATE